MIEYLATHLVYWHWLTAAIILIAAEAFMPGAFLLWIGLAAGFIGVLTAFMPITIEWQLTIFAILCPIMAILGRRVYKKTQMQPTDQPLLNKRTQQVVGRILTLSTPIENGFGRAVLDDSIWKIEGPDLPAGAHVRVVAAESNTLVVEFIEE